jgi:hypothetical protein
MPLNNLVSVIEDVIINPLIGLLFVTALALFFWGVAEFILKSSSDTDRETGKQHMIWGVIGMFIIASVGGIIALIRGTFGIPLP